ncbi:MAG: heparinase II/III-family protein [Prolixibacteraceae bacterium]|nr:heparinase II/III-family protein [Prolixibacteraceae bacterium]
MKQGIVLGLLFIALSIHLPAKERPFIWVQQNEREAILKKIENQEWAGKIYSKFIDDLDNKIKNYRKNKDKFLQGMPFNREEKKEGQIPPFHLTYHVKNGEQRNLDNATDKEMAGARTLMRYLQTGIDCGIAYYLTQDEIYAQCALDILYTFTKSVRQHELSDWHGRGGWLFPYDGFREVREIGYKVPLVYDFVAPYIKQGGKPYNFIKEQYVEFPSDEVQDVFRTYANITVNYGQTGSNHPVLEAPSLVYNALAMDDPAEREKWLAYFLTENTNNQDALNTMAAIYKNKGDIWPETSQYLNHVGSILTRLMFILNKYDPSLRITEQYPNVLYSLPALDYMIYPNGELVRWGDGKRKGRPPYKSYEEAFMLGKMDDNESITQHFGALLKKAIQDGKYRKKGILSVLWYDNDYEGEIEPFQLPRTDEVRHAGIYLQRNPSKTMNPKDGLMCFVGGAHMVHGHAEGMNIELYGEGQVLGIDHGRGSYQKDIHENYSRIFAAHNTVIVNGASRGEGGWVDLGINTVQLKSMEPMPKEEAISPNYSFSITSFIDDKGDKAEATQQRTLALIRTSETTGYYVDVFRSKSALPNEYHDFLYHNIGDKLEFLNDDLNLQDSPERYKANADLPWRQNRQYRHPGWHFFEDVKSSDEYTEDVKVQFSAKKFKTPIYMNLHIPGFKSREYSKVMAPKTFKAPKPYNNKPTPTLVIRKKGEAWETPFVVVYEPHNGKNTVQSVEKLKVDGRYCGLKVTSKPNEKSMIQYIFTQESGQQYEDKSNGIEFTGSFAVITTTKDGKLQNLYLGNGKKLRYKNTWIEAPANNANGWLDMTVAPPVFKSSSEVQSVYK